MEWAVYGAPKLIFFLNLGWKKKNEEEMLYWINWKQDWKYLFQVK